MVVFVSSMLLPNNRSQEYTYENFLLLRKSAALLVIKQGSRQTLSFCCLR